MIIYRYIQKELYSTLLAISVVLLLIFMSNQFIGYLRSAAIGDLPARVVMWVLWLRMPVLLGVLLPLSLFLTILLVYGRMYADNEMTVLFSSGFSRVRLYRITASFTAVVVVLTAVLSLWVGPYFNHYALNLTSRKGISPLDLIQTAQFQSFQHGKWLLYVEKINHDRTKLGKVFVVDQSKDGGILSAQSGKQQVNPKTGDTFLVFNDGNRYAGVPGQRDYQLIKFQQYGIRLSESTRPANKALEIPTAQLLKHHKNDMQAAELQWRFSIPIMALILGFMAVPLSRVKTRRSRYAQLIPAILLYVVYGNFMFVSKAWLKDGVIAHYIGMWWVHLVMLLVLAGLVFYQHKAKQ